MHIRGTWFTALVVSASLASAGSAFAADPDVSAELNALKARIAELEKKDNDNWLNEERKSEIRSLVKEVIEDARMRGQFADGGSTVGYKDGFYITDGANYKLVIGGFVQARYSFTQHHQSNTNDSSSGGVSAPFPQGTTENSNGFDIRRARVSFSGYAFSPNIIFKLEGDFYAGSQVASVRAGTPVTVTTPTGTTTVIPTFTNSSSSGNFTVTDAFIGYNFSDQYKIKAGSFKVPFTKVELMSDTNLGLMERPEVNTPFDAQRSIGVSLYGDIIKDQWSYEVNINNGSNSNIYRRVDTASTSTSNPNFNLDNRLGYYVRTQYSPTGISQLTNTESDLRPSSGDRSFIWMVGGAVGYESQNANGAFSQNTAQIPGLGNNDGNGYGSAYVLNGDLFRGTVDWSAKVAGWSFNTAAYFQQINANPLIPAPSSGSPFGLPGNYTAGPKTSFFQHGYYGQVGYMVTDNVEVVGRAGWLFTEGDPNIGDYYTVGANYYFFGNNAKLQADLTYAPESAFTDAGSNHIQNTHELGFRMLFQVKF
jgi:hypothetical protein